MYKPGDDCISIGDFISNITIVDIFCGPGHGISIGSLGKDGSEATVENITVHRAQFFGTSNGVRIKTYQAGRGNVRDVSFVNLTFHEVQNPIIIDQHYCFSPNGCQDLDHAVHIDDVKYIGATGTSASELAFNLNCSKAIPCTNITLENILLGPASSIKNVKSSCNNAYGFSTGIVNPSSCLR
ncbi:Glycoside hydrolase [Parasponia andersonii]|uniref:Glycoside hydrolase n=1 Tax=Parasponia andersonii TaxID=3476 RepID=A0A2P5BQE7_PARAD|nr:Glycoside hydrolase [Parasponia andersonii]